MRPAHPTGPGQVRIHQSISLTGAGAASGTLWSSYLHRYEVVASPLVGPSG